MTHRSRTKLSCLGLLAAGAVMSTLLLPTPLAAQDAQEILEEARDRYRSQIEDVDDYRVTQTVMGSETTTYYEKETVDGQPTFVLKDLQAQGLIDPEDSDMRDQLASPFRLYAELGERASLAGTETVDGESCYVLEVSDLSEEDLETFGGSASDQWTPKSLTVYMDEDDYLVRRFVLEGDVTQGGESQTATFTADLRDYRTVDGLTHPFLMEVSTEGFTMGMSPEERAQMKENLQQMQEKMANMPPQQRKMMEKVMGGQMQKMMKMMASGALGFTVEVKELEVNAGPPTGS